MSRTTKFQHNHDVSTPAGFVAAFDEGVTYLNNRFGWCSSGKRYPYEYGTGAISSPAYRQLGDNGVTVPQGPITTIPDEHLSEAGQTAKAEAMAAVMPALQAHAIAAAKWGVESGYLDAAIATEALNGLGIAGTFEQATSYENALSLSVSFRTGGQHYSGEGSRTLRKAISDAVTEAVGAVLTEKLPDDLQDIGSASTRVSMADYSGTRTTWVPAQADAPQTEG